MSFLRWFVRPFRKRTGKASADVGAKRAAGVVDVHMPKTSPSASDESKKHHNEQQQQQQQQNTSSDTVVVENDQDTLANLKHDEIIFVTRNSGGGYLIYSLIENNNTSSPSTSEKESEGKENPFSLTTTQLHGSQLPEDLNSFLLDGPPRHLLRSSSSADQKIHVLVSTHSGLQLASKFYSAVLQPLLGAVFGLYESESAGYELTVTESKNSVKEFARKKLKGGDETIFLLSGDGGVVDLINSFVPCAGRQGRNNSPVIALLPLGTANALFHSLHKDEYRQSDGEASSSPSSSSSSSLVLALRTALLKGEVRGLPIFRAEFSRGSKLVSSSEDEEEEEVESLRGAIVASYGFHASLVHESDTPQYRAFGAKRFGMAAGELLKLGHGYDCGVKVRRPGEEKEKGFEVVREGERFGYVLVTLVSNLEKTFTISPGSERLDGRLRLVYFGDVGGERTMEIMKGAYDGGKHVDMEGVGYEEVEEVRVEVREGGEEGERWRVVCVDGTIVRVGEGGWVSVRREEEGGRNGWRVLVG